MNLKSVAPMRSIGEKQLNIIIFCLLVAAVLIRANIYGDLRLSIGNYETISYIKSSRAPVFSWKIFAGQRLFTTNILFKTANDEKKCPLTSVSTPAIGEESELVNQPCFDRIALLQNLLAIFGWCFLAWMMARHLKNPYIKITTIIIITAFGFTPQIAEWDGILSPESLTLSMLAIAFALLMEIAFRTAESETPFKAKGGRLLFAGWMIIFLLWVFVRDVHLYAIAITLAITAPLLLLKKFRGAKQITIGLLILSAFFLIGYVSARDSLRASRFPLVNAIDFYIWPYPQRVEYFKGFDMPDRADPEYQAWADKSATKAFGLFLVSHPGFVASTLWQNMDQFKSNFIQPYYKPNIKYRETLLTIGEMLHPESGVVFLISLLLLIALAGNAIRYQNGHLLAWGWLAGWFILISAATLFLSFFGDVSGTRRHIMPSMEMFRLFIWIFIMPFLDLSLANSEKVLQGNPGQ